LKEDIGNYSLDD